MDYPLLIMVAAGMMKMATRDDSPLRDGAGKGLDWFSVATEPSGGGTSHLGLPLRVLEYLGIYRAKRGCGRPPEAGITHLGAPRWVVPSSVAFHTPSSPYKLLNIRKTLTETLDQKFRRRKAL